MKKHYKMKETAKGPGTRINYHSINAQHSVWVWGVPISRLSPIWETLAATDPDMHKNTVFYIKGIVHYT